ncbi:unnamed protein product [Closterium sp. Yama58-4]|nr:unnamed protein product [Closterium sp. Yama58-4]
MTWRWHEERADAESIRTPSRTWRRALSGGSPPPFTSSSLSARVRGPAAARAVARQGVEEAVLGEIVADGHVCRRLHCLAARLQAPPGAADAAAAAWGVPRVLADVDCQLASVPCQLAACRMVQQAADADGAGGRACGDAAGGGGGGGYGSDGEGSDWDSESGDVWVGWTGGESDDDESDRDEEGNEGKEGEESAWCKSSSQHHHDHANHGPKAHHERIAAAGAAAYRSPRGEPRPGGSAVGAVGGGAERDDAVLRGFGRALSLVLAQYEAGVAQLARACTAALSASSATVATDCSSSARSQAASPGGPSDAVLLLAMRSRRLREQLRRLVMLLGMDSRERETAGGERKGQPWEGGALRGKERAEGKMEDAWSVVYQCPRMPMPCSSDPSSAGMRAMPLTPPAAHMHRTPHTHHMGHTVAASGGSRAVRPTTTHSSPAAALLSYLHCMLQLTAMDNSSGSTASALVTPSQFDTPRFLSNQAAAASDAWSASLFLRFRKINHLLPLFLHPVSHLVVRTAQQQHILLSAPSPTIRQLASRLSYLLSSLLLPHSHPFPSLPTNGENPRHVQPALASDWSIDFTMAGVARTREIVQNWPAKAELQVRQLLDALEPWSSAAGEARMADVGDVLWGQFGAAAVPVLPPGAPSSHTPGDDVAAADWPWKGTHPPPLCNLLAGVHMPSNESAQSPGCASPNSTLRHAWVECGAMLRLCDPRAGPAFPWSWMACNEDGCNGDGCGGAAVHGASGISWHAVLQHAQRHGKEGGMGAKEKSGNSGRALKHSGRQRSGHSERRRSGRSGKQGGLGRQQSGRPAGKQSGEAFGRQGGRGGAAGRGGGHVTDEERRLEVMAVTEMDGSFDDAIHAHLLLPIRARAAVQVLFAVGRYRDHCTALHHLFLSPHSALPSALLHALHAVDWASLRSLPEQQHALSSALDTAVSRACLSSLPASSLSRLHAFIAPSSLSSSSLSSSALSSMSTPPPHPMSPGSGGGAVGSASKQLTWGPLSAHLEALSQPRCIPPHTLHPNLVHVTFHECGMTLAWARSQPHCISLRPSPHPPSGLGAFDFVRVGYDPGWPASVVITLHLVQQYGDILAALIRLHHVQRAVENLTVHVKGSMHRCLLASQAPPTLTAPNTRPPALSSSPSPFSMRASQLVSCMLAFITAQLQRAGQHGDQMLLLGIDDSSEGHKPHLDLFSFQEAHAQFLIYCTTRCLLDARSAPIRERLDSLLQLVLDVHRSVDSARMVAPFSEFFLDDDTPIWEEGTPHGTLGRETELDRRLEAALRAGDHAAAQRLNDALMRRESVRQQRQAEWHMQLAASLQVRREAEPESVPHMHTSTRRVSTGTGNTAAQETAAAKLGDGCAAKVRREGQHVTWRSICAYPECVTTGSRTISD